ncbi:MAG: PIN domain-containing protein [Actinomycetota bacterium]|jgi:predicted nucleic acid-binding protein|nr:PIN domain-containing protein [Actinomycetota bacterium]
MEQGLITLDTSGLFALLNRRDRSHEQVRAAFVEDVGPYLVPAGILAEIAYMIERRLGLDVLTAFVSDLETGRFVLECGEEDLGRVGDLVRRYEDLPLGFADASVISCAERNGGKVLTLDLRHFGVVAAEGTISLLP